jgi:hypothetical protein
MSSFYSNLAQDTKNTKKKQMRVKNAKVLKKKKEAQKAKKKKNLLLKKRL